MSLIPFWALNVVIALWFHKKYLNFCSEDEQRSYRFETTWGWVINDRVLIFGWTIHLRLGVCSNERNLKLTLRGGTLCSAFSLAVTVDDTSDEVTRGFFSVLSSVSCSLETFLFRGSDVTAVTGDPALFLSITVCPASPTGLSSLGVCVSFPFKQVTTASKGDAGVLHVISFSSSFSLSGLGSTACWTEDSGISSSCASFLVSKDKFDCSGAGGLTGSSVETWVTVDFTSLDLNSMWMTSVTWFTLGDSLTASVFSDKTVLLAGSGTLLSSVSSLDSSILSPNLKLKARRDRILGKKELKNNTSPMIQ